MTVFITIVDMEDITVVLNIDKIQTLCLINKVQEQYIYGNGTVMDCDPFTQHGEHVKICCDENNWVRTCMSIDDIETAIYHAQWDHERDIGLWRATGAQSAS